MHARVRNGGSLERQLSFILGDVADGKLYARATVVYMASVCFPDSLMVRVWENLLAMSPGTMVFSLRRFPGCHPGLYRIAFLDIQTSWSRSGGQPLYVYIVVPSMQNVGHLLEVPVIPLTQRLLAQFTNKSSSVASLNDMKAELPKHAAAWDAHHRHGLSLTTSGDPGSEDAGSPLKCFCVDLALGPDFVRQRLEKEPGLRTMTEDEGTTALHCAVEKGVSSEVLGLLLQPPVQVSASDSRGNKPLHLAAHRGIVEIVEELLKAGAEPHAKNGADETPLFWSGTAAVAVALLRSRAETNARDWVGRTPLHAVAMASGEREDVVQVLLTHRANANAVDRMGSTAAAYAFRPAVLDLLKSHDSQT